MKDSLHQACGNVMQVEDTAAPVAQAGILYYSEEVMAFVRDLSLAFARPPRYLRSSLRRSCDFWNRRGHPGQRPRATLPQVMAGIHLTVHATDCGIQHHVVAAGDLGEVHVHPRDATCVPRPLA